MQATLAIVSYEEKLALGPQHRRTEAKLQFRGRTLSTLGEEFRNKEPRLSRLWGTRLAAQMVLLPEFDGVFRAMQRSLRQAGLLD